MSHIPEPIYRLTCLRYIFLIYLGFIWAGNRISKHITVGQIILSIVSASLLVTLYYTSFTLEPFMFDTAWRPFHWICYFWPAFLLPWLLWKVFDVCPQKIKSMIAEMGRWSYEIFLMQMMVFTLYPHGLLDFGNEIVNRFVFVTLTLLLSIVPVVAYKKLKSRYAVAV